MYFTNVIDQLWLLWMWYTPDGQKMNIFKDMIRANKIPGKWFDYYSHWDLASNPASRFFDDWTVETMVVNQTTGHRIKVHSGSPFRTGEWILVSHFQSSSLSQFVYIGEHPVPSH